MFTAVPAVRTTRSPFSTMPVPTAAASEVAQSSSTSGASAMLTGVSHDLRTILTRFKLQLALAGDNPDLQGLNKDVEDMQTMLEGYLAFARGDVEGFEERFGKLGAG